MKKIIFIITFLISLASFGQVVEMQVVGTIGITTTQRDALTVPSGKFWIIYNTTTAQNEYWNGSSWAALDTTGSTPLTTKGDVFTYDTGNQRLDVGTNGQVLTADSAEATGLKWTTSGGGDMVLADVQTVTGAKTFDAATLLLNDTDSAFDLELGSTSTITTANKTLIFDVNDANRTLTISGNATVSGSNLGDQTSIVGITGTKAQFDTAVTDGNFLYVGDAVTDVTGGVGISSTGGATPSIALTVDELAEKSGDLVGTDRLVGTTSTTNWSETISGVPLSIFNNDSGWTSNVGDMVLANAQTNTGAKTFSNASLLLRNVANTFNGSFTNTNTADRIYTLQDAAGTLAFTSDITGTNSGTNTGDQTITLTGDVTGSGTGSFAATIANDAVTYAKIQNVVADNVILGNNAGAGGIVDELTATEVRTIINVEDNADVTDATNVNAAGAVIEADYNANTILAATTDDTPVTLTIAASRFVGRKATGDIAAMTPAEAITVLGITPDDIPDRIYEDATTITTQDLDYSLYEIYNFTVTGAVTFTESNLPTSGTNGKVILINITGDFALTYPANWSTNISGVYDGTVNNTIVVWYIKSATYKVSIMQPD